MPISWLMCCRFWSCSSLMRSSSASQAGKLAKGVSLVETSASTISASAFFELFEQTGGQGSHIVATHMNTANQMKMAIAGEGDIDGRPGVMITAQRGPKRFYPVQQIHTTSLCEISC